MFWLALKSTSDLTPSTPMLVIVLARLLGTFNTCTPTCPSRSTNWTRSRRGLGSRPISRTTSIRITLTSRNGPLRGSPAQFASRRLPHQALPRLGASIPRIPSPSRCSGRISTIRPWGARSTPPVGSLPSPMFILSNDSFTWEAAERSMSTRPIEAAPLPWMTLPSPP